MMHHIDNIRPNILKKQMLTLIVLQECYLQDKINALPLTLQIIDSIDNMGM